ncbi:MAG: ribonuclease P protein component 2 [Nanohaloarchaea archaeon SW_7_43_1]|nr:MAG: ribonuclease P protein component 2 [Nanohaloarchaea archaeon SW_7_43_1]
MKPLPPSIREKKRYLKFKIHAEKDVGFGEVADAIWDTSLNYLGSEKTGKANHWLIKNQFDKDRQTGIIKIRKSFLNNFRSSLAIIDEIGDKNGFIEIQSVSGSIKKLKND